MASFRPSLSFFLPCAVTLLFWSVPAVAFGAGNIASIARIEGQNWRHGDIEDTLLNILMSRAAGGKKFGKLDVKRVYFGNWLRDYSQAVDVGTVKYVSAEAIRIILWVLGFMSFGYATKEFEVTTERLGCYRPEEHIDNPKDYADNEDARQYDRRLRGPVNERRELAIDPETGLKNYIASERVGITTSAGLVRNLFGRSIQLGREYAHSKNKEELYEALRLLGTGCHCLEDFSAHSNFTELALIELGERGVFPHVGRRTQMELPGVGHPVYPLVTGTFGGVDFLHSVMGEFSDKATQSEIQELQGTIENSQNSGQGNSSLLQDLLNQVPSGLFGDKDEAGKADELQANAQAARLQNTHISPREPEEWTNYLNDVSKQIYPILEWHDEIMQSITETIEKIPILPALLEQLQEELNVFVFSLLAPFVLPIINQVKTELNTGSSEIIQSSKEKQLIVFYEDESSDPTHSMLSKDHFSNILNEPAGKVASQVLKWVVPQLIACWDDERIDVDRTLTRIINGVFNHPALRDYGNDGAVDGRRLMFGVVEKWWSEKDEQERESLRDQLSRDGVEQGRNHKEGVHDKGHGCGKPLGMPTYQTANSSGAVGGPAAGAIFGEISSALGGKSQYDVGYTGGENRQSDAGGLVGEAMGGGALGGILGSLVGGAFGGSEEKKQSERYEQGSSYNEGGYSQQVMQESRSSYGGGYETTTERRYEQPSGEWSSKVRREGRDARGDTYDNSERYGGGRSYKKESDSDESRGGKKHKKKHHKHHSDSDNDNHQGYGERDEYGESRRSDPDENSEGKKHKKKHHKHDSGSDNDKYKAYGERQRDYNTEERTRDRDNYGEPRRDFEEGYNSREGGRDYQGERYESRGYGSYGNNSGRGLGRDQYESGERGNGGQREEYGRNDEDQREERTEGYGDDRGYGRDDEDQERRGNRDGYGGDGY